MGRERGRKRKEGERKREGGGVERERGKESSIKTEVQEKIVERPINMYRMLKRKQNMFSRFIESV